METNFFFVGIQRRRLAAKVQPEEARFGPELDWGKLWRGQESVQRRRLASKVQPEEARFEPELDWGKLWRGQVFGELEAAFGSESTL